MFHSVYAKDSLTVFFLQKIYKLQATEIKSSLSVNMCICILDHGISNIMSDRVKVMDPPHTVGLQNHMFGQHTGEVWTVHWGSVDSALGKCGCFWQENIASVLGWWARWTMYYNNSFIL